MSTKIYNAYLTGASLGLILLKARKLREDLREVVLSNLRGVFQTGKAEATDPLLRCHAEAMLVEWFVDNTLKGMHVGNHIASLMVYPMPETGGLIVQTFGLDTKGMDTAERSFVRGIRGRDYHYQNSCDKPKNVTVKEWEHRKQVWDKVLPGIGTAAANGFTFELITERQSVELVLEAFFEMYPPEKGWDKSRMFSSPSGMASFTSGSALRINKARHTGDAHMAFVKELVERRFKPTKEQESLDSAAL